MSGEVIATVAYLTPGAEGLDVFGHTIPAPPPPNDTFVAGEGVKRRGASFHAETSGLITVSGQEIKIVPVETIDGSLTALRGHLHSSKAIAIGGGVELGASLSAAGKVDIGQSFAGSYVRAGGDLVVQGGMTGDRTSRAVVAGAMHVKFVQGGFIRCRGDVVIESNMTGGFIETDGNVTVLDPQGGIFGGTVIAKGSVTAANLGSQGGRPPLVWVGVNALQAARKLTLEGRRKALLALKDEVERSGLTQQAEGNERQKRGESRAKAKKRAAQIQRLLGRISDRLATIDLAPDESQSLSVTGLARRSSRVAVAGAATTVMDDIIGIKVCAKRGAIVFQKATESPS